MRFETKSDKKNRLKRQKLFARLGILCPFLLIVAIMIALMVGKSNLHEKEAEYDKRIEELRAEVEEQEKRAEELEEYKKYVQTKKFVEEVAKEKFGLLYPDEIIFKAAD